MSGREAKPKMVVRCEVCGREARPSHGHALQHGWPVCCGYTMRLESTGAFIAAIEKGGIPHVAASLGKDGE